MIRISDRDKRLFETLARYEVMSSRQIRKTVFSEIPETNYFRRMRELEKAKMIRRIGPMLDHSYAWLLAPTGKERMGFGENDLYKNRLTLEHDVTLTQVRMVLDSIGLGKNLITESQLRRRARDQNSRYGDHNKRIVVPDALIPVMIGERAEVFSLELELTFKNRQRYFELFRRYRKMEGIFAIWYLVPSRSMGDRMLEEWTAFNRKFGSYATTAKTLCVSEIDSFVSEPMTATVRGVQREVKISDWWKINSPAISQTNVDHPSDQRLIVEVGKKSEAA